MLRLHSRVGQLSAAGANLLSAQGSRAPRNPGFNLPRSLTVLQQVCSNSTAAPVSKNTRKIEQETKPITKLMVANRGLTFYQFLV